MGSTGSTAGDTCVSTDSTVDTCVSTGGTGDCECNTGGMGMQTFKACLYGVGVQVLSTIVGSLLSILVYAHTNAVIAVASFPISCAMLAAVMSVGHVRPLGERGGVGNRTIWFVVAVVLTCITWYASVTLATYVVNNIGDPAFSSYSQDIAASVTGDGAWVAVVWAVVLAPLCEEIVHRRGGYASMVSGGAPRWLACLLSSAVFAMSHGTMAHLMLTMVVGMVLCVVYERVGGFLPCVLIHIGVNAASLTLAPVVGDDVVSACIAMAVGLAVSVGCLLMLPRRSGVVCETEDENVE